MVGILCTIQFCIARLHALCNILGTGSYPSQFDQSHVRDDYGAYGEQYDRYSGDFTIGGEFDVKIRPPPSAADQPFGKPSQYDKEHRTNTGRASGGKYDQYVPDSARGSDYSRRSGPYDRQKPSQFDQEYRTGRGRGVGDQYDGHLPGSAGADRDNLRTRPGVSPPMSPRHHASQFDKAHKETKDRASGGHYKGHFPGSSSAPYETRGGPAGLHACFSFAQSSLWLWPSY